MSLCIAASGAIIALAANAFTLSWTHSVEKTEWVEHWVVENDRLKVVEATVQGSGAGIDLPDNAIRTQTGWTYQPNLPPIERLSLASSGATVSAWKLCADGRCIDLGGDEGNLVNIWAGDVCPDAKHHFR